MDDETLLELKLRSENQAYRMQVNSWFASEGTGMWLLLQSSVQSGEDYGYNEESERSVSFYNL